MTFPLTLIEITIPQESQKPIDWVLNERPFVPTEEMFPRWMTARVMLTQFAETTRTWGWAADGANISVGLQFPWVQDIFGYWIPMIETFPPEDRPLVEKICLDLMNDYLPNMDRFTMRQVTRESKLEVLDEIKRREYSIIDCGGRPILKELRFRLGLDGSVCFLKVGVSVDTGPVTMLEDGLE